MNTGNPREALRALRDDLNPYLYGVLWDCAHHWMATTPTGAVITATSPDALRRAVRDVDGTMSADTATHLPSYQETQDDDERADH